MQGEADASCPGRQAIRPGSQAAALRGSIRCAPAADCAGKEKIRAAPRRLWKLPKTKAGKAGPNPKKSIPYVPPPENKQWKNIHKQKSRMTVVYRKRGVRQEKEKTFNGKTFIGKKLFAMEH